MNTKRTVIRTWSGSASRFLKLFVAVVMFSVAAGGSAMAQSEDGIKSAFLFNFGKFAKWPAAVFADGNTPITVGFIGADSLADAFEKNIAGKNANGRDFAVKKLKGSEGCEKCNIIFIGDASQVPAVMAALKGKPVLTAGECDAFAEAGGMIRFIKEGARIGFDLDLSAATAANLELDPKVRQIARKVKGG